jgi:uncharacterized protein (TIGR00369 family)
MFSSHAWVHRSGIMHGGVVMALMDAAGLWADTSPGGRARGASCVSLSCNTMRDLRADSERVLRAEANVVKRGRSLHFTNIASRRRTPPLG